MEGTTGRRMPLLLLFVLSTASCPLLACPTSANQVKYCDKKASYQVTVKGFEVTPNPIVRGKPATFKISAITGGVITKGKLVIDVKYFGMHIHQEIRDLCKETSCPVLAGDFMLSDEESLPSFTPPGSYILIMKILGEEDKQLTCFNFDFSIGLMSLTGSS